MDPQLLQLRQEAFATALASKKIEDIEKAAATWKATADAWKAQQDSANQQRVLRYEGLKSFATFVVPFLTLLTLALTIWVQRDATLIQRDTARLQAEQVELSREANEDIQWRETIKNMAGTQSVISGLAAQTMLKPFLRSDRYKKQANELAQGVLGRVSDEAAFRDLFASVFESSTNSSLQAMVGVAKVLTSSFRDASGALEEAERNEAMAFKATPMRTPSMAANGPPLGQLPPAAIIRQQRNTFLVELRYACTKIAIALRNRLADAAPPDLTDNYLFDCDLSGTNLSGADLSNAMIQAKSITGADLSKITKFEDSAWPSTAWWRAGSISPELLSMLSENFYPYYSTFGSNIDYGDSRLNRVEYEKELSRLCPPTKEECKLIKVKFGKTPKRPA